MTRAAALLLAAACLSASPVEAQRHLPGLQVFEAPTLLLLDTRVESPAVYSGAPVAPRSTVGRVFEFQVFAPQVAGRHGFASSLAFTQDPDTLSRFFRVQSVKDWTGTELQAVPGSRGFSRGTSRMAFSDIPPSGHLLTVQLIPLTVRAAPSPLKVRCSVSIASIPPRRLMRAVGDVQVRWR